MQIITNKNRFDYISLFQYRAQSYNF